MADRGRGTTSLKGRVAVVIGGGSGVGRGIALALGEAGARVIVADVQAQRASAVVVEAVGEGGCASAATVDATDRASLQELARRLTEEHGALHILVNTTGTIIDRSLDRATDAEWEWMVNANLFTQVRSVAVLLPLMRESGGFRHIVTTAALAGFAAPSATGAHLGLYSSVKHAVVGYSDALREELRDEGIGVSLLLPHRVKGNLAANSARSLALATDDQSGVGAVDPPAGELTPARVVGPIVVAAIQRRQRYVLTRPVDLTAVQQRYRDLLNATPHASLLP